MLYSYKAALHFSTYEIKEFKKKLIFQIRLNRNQL